MKIRKLLALGLAAMMVCSAAGCGAEEEKKEDSGQTADQGADQETDQGETGDKPVIGVSLMTLQYEFFQDVKAGIEEAAGDDYELLWNDAALDLQSQIDAIENYCAQGVDAIILNAVDGDGIITALDTAEEKGIPVITVDMKPTSGTFATYIGSDNYLGGQLAAKFAAEKILQDKDSAKVVFLTNPMSSAAVERVNGFKDTIQEIIPGAEIIAEQGADTREAFMSAMEDILIANPEIDVVFSYSAQGGLGAYDAIQAAGREDEIAVIGFDASEEEQSAIAEQGCYKGSVIQFPDKLGAACIECASKVLAGETLEEEVPVEVGIYTEEKIYYASDFAS